MLGVVHLGLTIAMTVGTHARWIGSGLWAAVPLLGGRASGDAAINALAFWGGLGSFAVPLLVLGALVWHLAGRGIRVPAFVGWVIGAWCLLGAVILVPSPFILGTGAGVLIVIAARRNRTVDAAEV